MICRCGGQANWFDRQLCADPCGRMHMRCRGCGAVLSYCYWEKTSSPWAACAAAARRARAVVRRGGESRR